MNWNMNWKLRRRARALSLVLLLGSGAVGLPVSATADVTEPAVDRETLVIGLGKGIDNLDAMVTATGDSQRFAWMLFETLYQFDREGNLEPGLAKEFEVSEDGKIYTFALREGVKFHSGEEMTSADVVFSMNRMLDPETKSTRRPYFANLVESVEAPDEQTFVVKIANPDGAFLNKISGFLYILPEDYINSLASSTAFSAHPVGTGQYEFVSQEIGQNVELRRFEGYWGEKPEVVNLKYRVIPEDSSRVNALLAGEVDFIDTVPASQVAALEDNPDIVVTNVPISSPLHVRIYSNQPELPESKRAVRQALNYAIDKQAIIDSVLHGIGEPMNGYISRYYPYGHSEDLPSYGYDPEKARKLLEEAGYPDGFKTSIYHYPSMPKEVVEAVVAFWSLIGVDAEIKALDYAGWSRLNNNHQSGPMTIMQFSNAMYDPIHPISGGFTKAGTWSDYHNPEVEELVSEVERTVDRDQRDELFKKIDKIISEDAGAVFISEIFYSYAHKAALEWEPQIGSGYYIFDTINWK